MSSFRTRIDLTGQRFGRLLVVGYSHTNASKKAVWLCRCDCGNEKLVAGCHLKSGHTVSCGCYKRELDTERPKVHGLKGTRLYRIWSNMKSRCYIESVPCYKDYGGRGIKVCAEWLDDFKSFYDWAMVNGYNDDLSIDRIDNDGNYEPGNCRWVTQAVQSNNRRGVIIVSHNGETHSLKRWAEITGINYSTLMSRYKAGTPLFREVLKE